jgi:4,5-DOPA dioxygenase extradiol
LWNHHAYEGMMMKTKRLPTLFIGHGSPMNAIEQNDFTRRLSALAHEIEKPKAILCISAHWLTTGTWVTAMEIPKTIHDFYGFPPELSQIQYPASGDPAIAELIAQTITTPPVSLDKESWGLDHGTWSVLKHMYPKADVPVLQLSIDMSEPGSYHFELGKKLRFLRDKDVLIVGSGNIVHHLRKILWDANAKPWEWAIEFDQWAKATLETRDFKALTEDYRKTESGRLSVPTTDHYLPLLYVLGASDEKDELIFEYEKLELGSLSMRSLSFGKT